MKAPEHTALATTPERLLTDEQLLHAVELFAQGMNRTRVAQFFIDNDPKLQEQDATDPKELRTQLAWQLRSADPTSSRFAKTKYGTLYEQHRAAVQETLKERYQRTLITHLDFLEAAMESTRESIEETKHLLEHGTETEPVGAGEHATLANLLLKQEAHLVKLGNELLAMKERIDGD